jgi:hypothetical protein
MGKKSTEHGNPSGGWDNVQWLKLGQDCRVNDNLIISGGGGKKKTLGNLPNTQNCISSARSGTISVFTPPQSLHDYRTESPSWGSSSMKSEPNGRLWHGSPAISSLETRNLTRGVGRDWAAKAANFMQSEEASMPQNRGDRQVNECKVQNPGAGCPCTCVPDPRENNDAPPGVERKGR